MDTLEEAQARIAELEGQVTALADERDAAVGLGEQLRGELAPLRSQAEQVTAVAAERDATAAALAETQAAQLAATRRALLAEHAGQVVPELIAGDSAEALEASVETARGAFVRAAEASRAVTAAQTVPAGAASGRTVVTGEGLSPLEMISAGLRK